MLHRARQGMFLVLLLLGFSTVVDAQSESADRTATGPDYQIGIEDELRVFIWGESDLSVKVRVRPDGKITVPLVNDVYVVGLTTDQVREKITQQLSQYVREPVVTVMVVAINSFRVYFLGEVRRQGAINLYRPTRLLQAIATAGGLTEFSNKKIVLLREELGVEKRIAVDYKRLVAGDGSQENLYLKVGDTLLFQ